MRINLKFLVPLLVICYTLAGCSNGTDRAEHLGVNDTTILHAEYFKIIKGEPFDTLVAVNSWESATKAIEKYPLVPRDCTKALKSDIYAIPVPVRSCITMSTTYLPHLSLLEEEECVVGMSGTAFVYDSLYNSRIAQNLIAEIGSDAAPDFEKIISLAPDVVLAYGIAGADNTYIQKLRSLGIKVLVINDYLENHPLGKLEYIKLFGAITDRFAAADSIFKAREAEYVAAKNCCADYGEPTKVLINLPFRDIWYVPGGDNYTSILIADAGGNLLGSKEGSTISSQESFEKMYTLGREAQVWIHLNSFTTLSGVKNENHLYQNLQVFKDKKLYNNVKRSTPKGGSDFWEGGAVDPAEILKDLITIFHPDVAEREFGDRELKYYINLQ